VPETQTKLRTVIYTTIKITRVSVTEVGALSAAGWAWSTQAAVSASLLPAAGSMQSGLAAAVGAMSIGGKGRVAPLKYSSTPTN